VQVFWATLHIRRCRKIRIINRSHSTSSCTSTGRFVSDSWSSCTCRPTRDVVSVSTSRSRDAPTFRFGLGYLPRRYFRPNRLCIILIIIPGAARWGRKARPAAAIVRSCVCARTICIVCGCRCWLVCSSECDGSSFHRDGSTHENYTEAWSFSFCEGLWNWNLHTRSSSAFDAFCWSSFWKLARIDRVRCCRRSAKQPIVCFKKAATAETKQPIRYEGIIGRGLMSYHSSN